MNILAKLNDFTVFVLLFLLIRVRTHLENYSSLIISVTGNAISLLPYYEKSFVCVCVYVRVYVCVYMHASKKKRKT